MPTPKSTPSAWSELELAIRRGIRADAAVGCLPRRHDLPDGTIAAVECHPGVTPVDRVGFYLFATPDEAYAVYRDRIKDEDVRMNSEAGHGNFERGLYTCGDEAAQGECSDREAGFVNDSGYANYRAVINGLYIGALGTDDNADDLRAWAWISDESSGVLGEADPVPEAPTLYWGELISGVVGPSEPSEPSDPYADLSPLYAALRPEQGRVTSGQPTYDAGEDVEFTYDLVNRSTDLLVIPYIDFYGEMFYLAGTEQTWIERLGPDSEIPCMGFAGRNGTWYAAGGQILATEPISIAPAESVSRSAVLYGAYTQCFASGRYRYHIEYKPLEGEIEDVIAVTVVDVDFVGPEPPPSPPPSPP